jgi:hypothetical protein
MAEPPPMSGQVLEDAYRYSREATLKKYGKGTLWLMVKKGWGAGLTSTSPKDSMVAAIMRQEAKEKLEKEKGLEVGGGLWYVAC